jgi:HTH-type transcriptional regulator/antitoxin HigA
LGIEAEFWMNAQKNFELDSARIEKKNQYRIESIAQWNMVCEYVPHAYFKKQLVLSGDPVEDVPKIKALYNVTALDEVAVQSAKFGRYRQSEKLATDQVNLLGWCKLVEYKAKEINVHKFDHTKQTVLLKELREIIKNNKKTLSKTTVCLHDYGIKIVFQEKASKTPVDGMCFWSEGRPAIAMTLRFKRLDNFAFTLFHELGHVYLHLLNDNTANFVDIQGEVLEKKARQLEEKEANDFASENLIPKKDWLPFYEAGNFTEAAVKRFAKQAQIHPAVVLGRISHEQGFYARKTKLMVDVT